VGEGVLSVTNEQLRCIRDAVGTPCYVYDAQVIRRQWAAIVHALHSLDARIHYSVKANSNRHVLALLRNLGARADIVSLGEMLRAQAAGFEPADMVFSGVGKTPQELAAAMAAGVGFINIESIHEFESVTSLAPAAERGVSVGIRVNPDVAAHTHPYTQTGERGGKFGVPLDQVVPLACRVSATDGLRLVSVGMHIGSQIADPEPYRAGVTRLVQLVEEIRAAGIDTLTSVNVGGGLAIPQGTLPGMDPMAFADAVRDLGQRTGLTMLVEPGRFLVGEAGTLLTTVLYTKHSGGRDFLVVDAGMNDLVRPSYYAAIHEIDVVAGGGDPSPLPPLVDVVGPICESGDFLGRDRSVPGATRGALLAVRTAGAYGFAMASTYNSRPRPPEILVDNGRFAVVRTRETHESLWRDEVPQPTWVDFNGSSTPPPATPFPTGSAL
jgi:diaminopimelate decarboxylase